MATLVAFDVDDDVQLVASFVDASEQPADPSDVTVTVVRPDGTAAAPTDPSEEEMGVWVSVVRADQAGRWWWRVEFTGDRQHAEEAAFFVRERRVPEESS